MHPFGQFLDRQVGVLLQNAQHLDVDFVERDLCCHILFYLVYAEYYSAKIAISP